MVHHTVEKSKESQNFDIQDIKYKDVVITISPDNNFSETLNLSYEQIKEKKKFPKDLSDIHWGNHSPIEEPMRKSLEGKRERYKQLIEKDYHDYSLTLNILKKHSFKSCDDQVFQSVFNKKKKKSFEELLEDLDFQNNNVMEFSLKTLINKNHFAIHTSPCIIPDFPKFAQFLTIADARCKEYFEILDLRQFIDNAFYELKFQNKFYELYIKFLNDILKILQELKLSSCDDIMPEELKTKEFKYDIIIKEELKEKMFTFRKITNYLNFSRVLVKHFETSINNKKNPIISNSMPMHIQLFFHEIKTLLNMEIERMEYGEKQSFSRINGFIEINNWIKCNDSSQYTITQEKYRVFLTKELPSPLLKQTQRKKNVSQKPLAIDPILYINAQKYGYAKERIINMQESIILSEQLNENLNKLKLQIEKNKEEEQEITSFLELLKDIHNQIEAFLKNNLEQKSKIEAIMAKFADMNLPPKIEKKIVNLNNFSVKFHSLVHIKSIIKKLIANVPINFPRILLELNGLLNQWHSGIDYRAFLLMILTELEDLIETCFNNNDPLA